MKEESSSLARWIIRRRRLLLLLGVLAIVVYGVSGGCGAQHVPPRPTPEQRTLLREPPFPYSVAVVPWSAYQRPRSPLQGTKNAHAYAEGLADRLEKSNAFRSVVLDTTASAVTDLIAISTGVYCNTAVIPLWSALTLGLFPTVFHEADCVGAVFRSGNGGGTADSAVVHFRYEGTVIMGWLAVPVGALPRWAKGGALSHRRYRDLFRLAIMEQREAIARVVRK